MIKVATALRITGKILPVSISLKEHRSSGNSSAHRANGIPTKYQNQTISILNKYWFGIFLVLAGLAAPVDARASDCYPWPLRESKGSYAYDGDTIYIRMPGLPDTIAEMSVRVAGIDAPEIRGACEAEKAAAKIARNRVRQLLNDASLTNTSVQFCNPEWGRYGGRVVAWVAIGNTWLHELLIGEGLARPYSGGERAGWCNVPD
ncbi:thermonuclease family protein [Thalassospira xiamenensis]|jgi:endonuclease YncB( thermonuclease family)|uniref:thermonuclease family protein n=1 Tax=Thalassospira xiamenensis TaxID=220697 RepID=UPI0020002E1C|nr:thermonuclease family protein [Thalassospira xiamenensis]MCK2169139.1 thermonuclease family protein [Thalassospira xiamenensis]